MTPLPRSSSRAVVRTLRASRWGIVASLASFMIFLTLYASSPPSQSAGSDGFYTWLFTRSIVFDHDIDFKNDYALCGDPYGKNIDRGTGHPDNPFYIGPTVTWAPLLWSLRHALPLPTNAPEAVKEACTGPLVGGTLWLGTLLGALTVWLMYRIGRRYTGDGTAALGAALLGLCTSMPAYAAILPSYSHVYDTFWASLVVLTALRAGERPQSIARWLLAGVCVGIGLLQRPVSVFFGVVPLAVMIGELWRQWGAMARALATFGVASVICGLLPQLLVYEYLYGHLFVGAPHGRFYMQYGHAHPWLVLFAPHGGLFYTAPVVWLALPGVVLGLRSRATRWLTVALVVGSAMTTWLSSAALDWHGSGTFGARRLTSLLPLLAPPMAMSLHRLNAWLRANPALARASLGVAFITPIAFTICGAALGLWNGRVSTEVGLSQANFYGTGDQVAWGMVDAHVGDLAILPAEAVFAMRYGLHMRAFREATEPLYQRNYRSLAWERQTIDLRNGAHVDLVTGMSSTPAGMRVVSRRASIVFAAQWPFATGLRVSARTREPTTLRIGRRTLFHTYWYGDVALRPGANDGAVSIPEGGFDSGIMEIVVECPDPSADVVLGSITIDDDARYPPAL